ncbi:MAG TPA: hypothetical protein VF666_09795 [Pyrinomonadaceae bacterium]
MRKRTTRGSSLLDNRGRDYAWNASEGKSPQAQRRARSAVFNGDECR